ncbi:DUF262 domain-containing protein [Treponema sp. R6D11]
MDKAQCLELFEDIEISFQRKEPHYLGNITYYPTATSGASFTELILIDGQQRITSILLLLCAIRDSVEDETIINCINEEYLHNKTPGENFSRIRLKQTSHDAEDFEKIIKKTQISGQNKVVENYNYFKELVSKSKVSPRDLYETIAKLEIVEVNLQTEENLAAIQTVFEKINSTGKPLSSSDLIRNYLLTAENTQVQDHLYKNFWVKIENIVGVENINKFSQCFLIMNSFQDVSESKTYKEFKKFYIEKGIARTTILEEMLASSRMFSFLHNETIDDKELLFEISIINSMGASVLMYPLLIFLLEKMYNNNKTELKGIFTVLADFLIRYKTVLPSSGGGTISSVVRRILEKLTKQEINMTKDDILFELSNSSTPAGRFPDNTEFETRLKEPIRKDVAKAILYKILYHNAFHPVYIPISQLTLEHILPQTLTAWWKKYLGGDEIANYIHTDCLNKLGNLTLISGPGNSSLSNKPWPDKRSNYKNSDILITQRVAAYPSWNKESVIQRNESLSQDALSAITAPLNRTKPYETNSVAEENLDDGLYPFADIDSPTGTKPVSIVYKSMSKKVSNWGELFKSICRILIDVDSNRFEDICSKNLIHKSTSVRNPDGKDPTISKQANLITSAKKIGSTAYFCETCFSAERAVHYSKQLLDLFELTEDFFIEIEN